MNAKDRIVHGAFTNSDEVIAEIKSYKKKGTVEITLLCIQASQIMRLQRITPA